MPEVYFIALLEFDVDVAATGQYLYDVALLDKQTKEIFYNKLGFKFIVLPKFVKKESELETDMDQWLYLLKHISQMNQIPAFLDKRIFRLIFSIGEVANLKKEDLMSYEASLKRKMDTRSVLESARRAGLAEGKMAGLAEGERKKAIEAALKMKKSGLELTFIADTVGLSIEEIEKL